VTSVGSTLYGIAGQSNQGTGGVYSLGLDGSNFSVAQKFLYPDNALGEPVSGLTLVGSTLYGVTPTGGVNNAGTIFTMNSDGSNYHVIYSFSDTPGALDPAAALIQVGSELYGTTSGGGGYGTIFSIGLDGSNFQTLHSFDGRDGRYPAAALTLVGSTLYGTSVDNIFSISPDGSNFQVVHSFDEPKEGWNSHATLVASGNTLYGTNTYGGPNGFGSVFAITVPEPSSIALLTIGAFGLAALARRRAA
jgi:uncharacterized repeat protein (TIGR03803 family)